MKKILIVDDHPVMCEGLESVIDGHKTHIREKPGLSNGNKLTRYAMRWSESGMLE